MPRRRARSFSGWKIFFGAVLCVLFFQTVVVSVFRGSLFHLFGMSAGQSVRCGDGILEAGEECSASAVSSGANGSSLTSASTSSSTSSSISSSSAAACGPLLATRDGNDPALFEVGGDEAQCASLSACYRECALDGGGRCQCTGFRCGGSAVCAFSTAENAQPACLACGGSSSSSVSTPAPAASVALPSSSPPSGRPSQQFLCGNGRCEGGCTISGVCAFENTVNCPADCGAVSVASGRRSSSSVSSGAPLTCQTCGTCGVDQTCTAQRCEAADAAGRQHCRVRFTINAAGTPDLICVPNPAACASSSSDDGGFIGLPPIQPAAPETCETCFRIQNGEQCSVLSNGRCIRNVHPLTGAQGNPACQPHPACFPFDCGSCDEIPFAALCSSLSNGRCMADPSATGSDPACIPHQEFCPVYGCQQCAQIPAGQCEALSAGKCVPAAPGAASQGTACVPNRSVCTAISCNTCDQILDANSCGQLSGGDCVPNTHSFTGEPLSPPCKKADRCMLQSSSVPAGGSIFGFFTDIPSSKPGGLGGGGIGGSGDDGLLPIPGKIGGGIGGGGVGGDGFVQLGGSIAAGIGGGGIGGIGDDGLLPIPGNSGGRDGGDGFVQLGGETGGKNIGGGKVDGGGIGGIGGRGIGGVQGGNGSTGGGRGGAASRHWCCENILVDAQAPSQCFRAPDPRRPAYAPDTCPGSWVNGSLADGQCSDVCKRAQYDLFFCADPTAARGNRCSLFPYALHIGNGKTGYSLRAKDICEAQCTVR